MESSLLLTTDVVPLDYALLTRHNVDKEQQQWCSPFPTHLYSSPVAVSHTHPVNT